MPDVSLGRVVGYLCNGAQEGSHNVYRFIRFDGGSSSKYSIQRKERPRKKLGARLDIVGTLASV